jgi:hypothetical protein
VWDVFAVIRAVMGHAVIRLGWNEFGKFWGFADGGQEIRGHKKTQPGKGRVRLFDCRPHYIIKQWINGTC